MLGNEENSIFHLWVSRCSAAVSGGASIFRNYAAMQSISQIPAFCPFLGRRLSQGWPSSALKDTPEGASTAKLAVHMQPLLIGAF